MQHANGTQMPTNHGAGPIRRRLCLALAALALLGVSMAEPGPVAAAAVKIAGSDPALPDAARPPDVASVPIASHAMVETRGEVTRFVLDFSRPVAVDAFVLADPYRAVVDLPEMRFDLATMPKEARGLIRSWRYGLFATGRSRLVFDLTGPARIAASRVEPEGTGGARLTLEFAAVAADAFVADVRAQKPESPAKADRLEPAAPGQKLVIVVDPGHGGIDNGTSSPRTGMPEKQIVLEFGQLLAKKLSDSGRYDVFLTRSSDTFVPLGERVAVARSHHADLLVSIHADAELDRSVRGSTIFTRSEKASDARAAALAQKENQSDAVAGVASDDKADDISDILFDLTQRETRHFSHAVATYLVAAMAKSGRMVKQDPHRSAQLKVLKAYDVPSVLIELGFLSNKDDEAELVSPDWREKTAAAIVGSIDKFFASREARAAP